MIEFSKRYRKGFIHPGRYFHNPNIDDWLYINDIDCDDISEELQFYYEHTMWNPIRGPKYDILQENVIYENINKSYSSKELVAELINKYCDDIVKPRFVETMKDNKNSFTIEINDKELINDEEFKSLLNFYNYYVSYCEKRKNNYEVYIEPYKPEEMTDYIYDDCKGIVYRFINDNGLKRLNHHGLVPRHDNDRYYPRYIFVVADKDKNELKETLSKVQREIKKTNIHLIRIDLNKYENKLKFYKDPASVNYAAFVTREYIPKYCCEEIDIKKL